MPKILAFAGSIKKDSFNLKPVKIAAKRAESAGAAVTVVDMADYPMSLYDQDLQLREGKPEKT